jgi:predicted ATPase
MRVSRLLVQNHGPIERAELTLGDLTVLVGPNGVGKTTTLRAIEKLANGGPLGRSGSGVLACGDECVQFAGTENRSQVKTFQRWPMPVYVRLDAASTERPGPLPNGDRLIAGDSWLAGAVTRLILERPEVHLRLVEQLRQVVPGFAQVRSRPRDGGQFELRFDFDHAPDVRQAEVSTGTLFALSLLVATAEGSPNRSGTVVLIDDPETGLHPGAQEELIGRLVAITAPGDVQIVLATHSPYVVDAAGAQRVYVYGRGPTGSVARPLTDHPDAQRSLEILTAGEFWGSVGEAWVGGVRAP